MVDVILNHHKEDRSDELPRHPPIIVPADCESAPPPKRRQQYKSLTVLHLYNKLGGTISIQFDLEGGNVLCSW